MGKNQKQKKKTVISIGAGVGAVNHVPVTSGDDDLLTNDEFATVRDQLPSAPKAICLESKLENITLDNPVIKLGNLPYETTDDQIANFLSDVEILKIGRHFNNKGTAFITVANKENALKAFVHDGKPLARRNIKMDLYEGGLPSSSSAQSSFSERRRQQNTTSAADEDTDWRSGARPQFSSPSRGRSFNNQNRPPRDAPNSEANTSSDWRANRKVQETPQAGDARQAWGNNNRRGNFQRSATAADSSSSWRSDNSRVTTGEGLNNYNAGSGAGNRAAANESDEGPSWRGNNNRTINNNSPSLPNRPNHWRNQQQNRVRGVDASDSGDIDALDSWRTEPRREQNIAPVSGNAWRNQSSQGAQSTPLVPKTQYIDAPLPTQNAWGVPRGVTN